MGETETLKEPFGVEIVTLAPELWPQILGPQSGLVGRAFADGRMRLRVRNLRDYGQGNYHQVDDAPFGGGAGMVLMVEPLHRAIQDARQSTPGPVILLTPRGAPLRQELCRELAQGPGFTLVCGRFEGVDERVRGYVDREISVGDFVLSAGDPAAWCLVDAIARLQPGVLGNAESLTEESFATSDLLEYPQYTRPAEYDGVSAPAVLLSGDHGKVRQWRADQARELTARVRPDLVGKKRKKP